MRKSGSRVIILERIALHGELTMYALNKLTGYSTSTIFDSIHQLIKQKLVKQQKKGYSVTIAGLICVLQKEEAWESVDTIVFSNMKLFPQYFGLWDVFKRYNVKDIAILLLRFAVAKLSSGVPAFPEKIDGRKPTLEDWLPRFAIYPYEALINGYIHEDDAERWLDMLIEVPEAEKIYINTLQWMITSHKSAMESFSRALEVYKEIKGLSLIKKKLEES
jgi:hypothetical protein